MDQREGIGEIVNRRNSAIAPELAPPLNEFTFARAEVKYRIPGEKLDAFMQAIEPYMQMDQYGIETVCNVYYDTDDNLLISRSLDKPVYKEKIRLRSYGVPTADSVVFAEMKKKSEKIVYKRRAMMTLAEAEEFLNNGVMPADNPQMQIIREMDYFMKFYQPTPKLFLAYERAAFFGKEDSEFRMTLDWDIRYRTNHLSLSYGAEGTPLETEETGLLEVKAGDAIPLWLVRVMNGMQIYPSSFSKYGRIYTVMNQKTCGFPQGTVVPDGSQDNVNAAFHHSFSHA